MRAGLWAAARAAGATLAHRHRCTERVARESGESRRTIGRASHRRPVSEPNYTVRAKGRLVEPGGVRKHLIREDAPTARRGGPRRRDGLAGCASNYQQLRTFNGQPAAVDRRVSARRARIARRRGRDHAWTMEEAAQAVPTGGRLPDLARPRARSPDGSAEIVETWRGGVCSS